MFEFLEYSNKVKELYIGKDTINNIIELYKKAIIENEEQINKIYNIDRKSFNMDFNIKKIIDLLETYKNKEPIQNVNKQVICVTYYSNPYITINLCIQALLKKTSIIALTEDGLVNTNMILIKIFNQVLKDFKICKMIRDKGLNFPVIMLTAKIEDKDKIQGLTLGADDYITKPFNPLELIARVKSAYRRYTKYNEKSEENIIYINGLEIDQDKHICRLYETQIELTPMEFDILLYLAQKRGNVVSSEELFEKVWKEKYLENNNTVMVHIRRIREKLKENTKNPKFIKTVWGVGYKIEK